MFQTNIHMLLKAKPQHINLTLFIQKTKKPLFTCSDKYNFQLRALEYFIVIEAEMSVKYENTRV